MMKRFKDDQILNRWMLEGRNKKIKEFLIKQKQRNESEIIMIDNIYH